VGIIYSVTFVTNIPLKSFLYIFAVSERKIYSFDSHKVALNFSTQVWQMQDLSRSSIASDANSSCGKFVLLHQQTLAIPPVLAGAQLLDRPQSGHSRFSNGLAILGITQVFKGIYYSFFIGFS
jgi:hypothetical protein